jgi:alkylation response protein AidB-like acyl-CoA dehydrogenase
LTETGTLTLQERDALADLAFTLGARYANRRLNDLEAARDHWAEVCAAGLSACSLPAQYGGAGGMSELLLVAERLAAGGYPAGKLTLSVAVAGAITARHGRRVGRLLAAGAAAPVRPPAPAAGTRDRAGSGAAVDRVLRRRRAARRTR